MIFTLRSEKNSRVGKYHGDLPLISIAQYLPTLNHICSKHLLYPQN